MDQLPLPTRRGSLSDRIAALVVLAGSALYLLQARTFRPFLRTEPLGPATFPFLVGGMMFVLGGILLISSFRPRPGAPGPREGGVAPYARPAILWVLLALYVLLFEVVGFPLATAGFLLLSLRLLGVRPWWRAALVAVLFAAACWYGFRALDVRLPVGDIFR